MPISKVKCKIVSKTILSPSCYTIAFKPHKKFSFEPGQFISVKVPYSGENGRTEYVRRIYSLASGPEISKKNAYELCIKLVPNGKGSNYLAKLKPGESFEAKAAFGHFDYKRPQKGKSVCFIATGSGIAPFRSIIQSEEFQKNKPEKVFMLFGARHENEVLFKEEFDKAGVEMIACVSQPSPFWQGASGRVTDYLRTHAHLIPWHMTDFYLCGNQMMLKEVFQILRGTYGIAERNIRQEAFAMTPYLAPQEEEPKESATQETLSLGEAAAHASLKSSWSLFKKT